MESSVSIKIIDEYIDKFPNPDYYICRDEIEKALNFFHPNKNRINSVDIEIQIDKYIEGLKSFEKNSFLGRINLRKKKLRNSLAGFDLKAEELKSLLPALEYTDTLINIMNFYHKEFRDKKEKKMIMPLKRKVLKIAKELDELNINNDCEKIFTILFKMERTTTLSINKIKDNFLFMCCKSLEVINENDDKKKKENRKNAIRIANHFIQNYFNEFFIDVEIRPYTNRIKIENFKIAYYPYISDIDNIYLYHSPKYLDTTKKQNLN